MRYEWDARKAATNLDKHGVDFADAVAVLEDPSALTLRADDEAGEERLVTAGVDFLGRVLVVVYTHRRDSIRLISARPATKAERRAMNEREYDFEGARQGAVVPPTGNKTRITIRIDSDVLNWFRQKVHQAGGGNYQTLINEALREHVQQQDGNLEQTLRRVIREELQLHK